MNTILILTVFLVVVFAYRLAKAVEACRDAVAARKQAALDAVRAIDHMVELVDRNR